MVHRTFSVGVDGPVVGVRRADALLVGGGYVWAWMIDRDRTRRETGQPTQNSFNQLSGELKHHKDIGGELSFHAKQSVVDKYSSSWFEAHKRHQAGERASYPRRKVYHQSVTWRKGWFWFWLKPDGSLDKRWINLQVAKGTPELWLHLTHEFPYDPKDVRAVTLSEENGELVLGITALVKKADPDLALPQKVAGGDPGIIHMWALAAEEDALLISARAVRAEHRLHLVDQKARQRKMSKKQGPTKAKDGNPYKQGSKRYRQIHTRFLKAEASHKGRVTIAQNTAANIGTEWAVRKKVTKVALGNPKGIEQENFGRVANKRNNDWSQAQARHAFSYDLEVAGIPSEGVDERGSSSHCPYCGFAASKKGRWLKCKNPDCKGVHHRDLAGGQNISVIGGGVARPLTVVEHRRVGQPARRDRRRHLWDERRTLTQRHDTRRRAGAKVITAPVLRVAPPPLPQLTGESPVHQVAGDSREPSE